MRSQILLLFFFMLFSLCRIGRVTLQIALQFTSFGNISLAPSCFPHTRPPCPATFLYRRRGFQCDPPACRECKRLLTAERRCWNALQGNSVISELQAGQPAHYYLRFVKIRFTLAGIFGLQSQFWSAWQAKTAQILWNQQCQKAAPSVWTRLFLHATPLKLN